MAPGKSSDTFAALAQQFGIMRIPTLVVMESGQIQSRTVGAKLKGAILSML